VQFVGEIRHSLEDVYLSLIQAAQGPVESGKAQGKL